jgi:hypothetical protein
MKKSIILFVFLISNLCLFSQDNLQLKGHFNFSLDSITAWSYDIVPNYRIDTNLICRIAIFRNKEIPDKLSQEVYGKGIRPSMIFNIYPVLLIDTIKKMSLECKIYASCIPPNVGGDYYILQDYILVNYSSCVNCASSDYKTDLCRANINKILSGVSKKHYGSIDDLIADLPIKKMKFK